MTWALGLILKPFFALVILVPVYVACKLIYRYMPDSKLKRVLFSPIPGHKARRWD